MDINYTVHSYAEQEVPITVTLPGVGEVQAKTMGIVVELVEEGGENTITLRKVPSDLEAARSLFTVGATLVAGFTASA